LQVGHAPCGVLKENILGSISAMEIPQKGQANFFGKKFVLHLFRFRGKVKSWVFNDGNYDFAAAHFEAFFDIFGNSQSVRSFGQDNFIDDNFNGVLIPF